LRHTFASWLALGGTSILILKDLLGHKTLAMTERYAHLSPDHKRTAASGIDGILNAEGTPSTKGKKPPGKADDSGKKKRGGGKIIPFKRN
jgi:hypothetical protein